jgi:LysM repeat protein
MATADERREARKKTGQAKQAAGKYKGVAPSKAAVKNTTYTDPVRDRDNRTTTTTTVAAPAPKAKVTNYKAGNPNAVVNKGGLGVSQQNRPRIPGTNKPGVKSFGYGYYDQNKEWISPREDMQDGYGPGGSGAKFGGAFGGVSNALGATGYGSGEKATGIAKFIQDGGVLGTIAKGLGKGIKGVAQDIGGAFKPASYTVKPGDNLSKIAAANNMTLEQLLAKNPGLDPKTPIQPKQQIKIGGLFGGTQTPEQAAANAAMMAQMDRTGNNNSVAAAPMGVQGVQCPAGQVFNPVTNSCEPALSTMTQAAQTSMPAGIPGIDNPSYEQIMAYRNAPQPLAPNLSSLTGMTGQFGAGVRMAAEGGIMSLVEAEGGNEKTLISDAIAAIESGAEDEAAAVALAKFVQVHGEDALRNLVEKVQSGDYADTRERFANGENGIVNGPGDGSGTDDKVPATIDGKQDVLLTNNEYVLREPTTAALEAALGKGGLDAVNAAEGDAPAVLLRLMNKVQAERQTA